MSTLLEQKCPNCGGSVEFDVGAQKLKCPFCDTEFEIEAMPQEEIPMGSIQDSMNWNSQGNQWAAGETDGMSVYVCKSCAGEIVADATTGATSCPYCGNQVIMQGQFSGALRPDLVIPFKLDKKAAKEGLKKHISSKKFVPKAFKQDNHLDEVKGVYVPHWLFSCDAEAEVLYDAETMRTWSDSDYDYTEISEYEVYRCGNIGFDNVPVDGSSKMPDDLMESIEPFDLSQAVDFNTAYLAGYLADKYDVDPEQSMNRANDRIKESAADTFKSTVQGYTTVTKKFVNMNVVNGIYRYALYPVWILKSSWNGNDYTFAMNGQTGKFVGDIPTDKKLARLVTFLLGLGISAVACLVYWIYMTFIA